MLGPLKIVGIICGLAFSALVGTPAQAACPQEREFSCIKGFDEIEGLVSSGKWLIALARHESNDGPRQYSLLRIGRDLNPRSLVKNVVPIPWEEFDLLSLSETTVLKPRLRHLLVDGDSIFVTGEIEFLDENGADWSAGWAARFDKNFQVLWNRIYSRSFLMKNNQYIQPYVHFESAQFNRNSNSLIVVGRTQQGADPNSTCEFPSNSLVVRLDFEGDVVVADDVLLDEYFAEQDRAQQSQLLARRHAFFDISATGNLGEYIVTGFRSGPKNSVGEPAPSCQDNIFWSVLHIPSETQSSFIEFINPPQTIGSPVHNDLTYSITGVGQGRYLLAGRGHNAATGFESAQLYMVDANSFSIKVLRNDHHPLGTDGRSRYLTVHKILGEDRYVAAGYASYDSRQPNAIWSMYETSGSTLEQVKAPILVKGLEHARVKEVASFDSGGVFAAGTAYFDNVKHVWIAPLFDIESNARMLVSKIHQPDQNLRRLNTLNQKDGYFELTGDDINRSSRYYGVRFGEGAQLDFVLTLNETTIVEIAFVAQSGDADLILMDSKYQIVAFSDFQGDTNEMLEARLEPGRYYLSIPALTNIPAYELRVSTGGGETENLMQQIQALREIDRGRLIAALEGEGYSLSAAPDTKMFGFEAVLALRAAHLSAEHRTGNVETLRAAIRKAFGQ